MQDSGSRVCVVTGATSGIGRATSIALAAHFERLILLGRNQSRADRLLGILARRYPQKRIKFVTVELGSLQDTSRAAEVIRRTTSRIDILINNAGARIDSYLESPDGFESTFATNHLGHFLLTALLADQWLAAPNARIINVSSSAHAAATRPESWSMSESNYDRRQAYARSKLANLLFTYELSRRLTATSVTVNAMHPGGVASAFARNNGLLSWSRHLVAHALKGELITPRRGADTLVYLATDPAVATCTGKYFYRRQRADSSPLSRDVELARHLWLESLRLTGLNENLGAAWQRYQPEVPELLLG